MERATVDFGIDLGTTNSSIAIVRGIETEVFKNNDRQECTPSAVYIDNKGRLRVGDLAKEQVAYRVEDAYSEFKLQMGTQHIYHFASSGRQMTPEELSAEVLKSLRADVKYDAGEEVIAAVISVPAAFELPQCEATKRAAQLAGLSFSPLIQEPTAAAMAYGFQSESDRVFWMVYDFGGGTFDAAIIQLREGLIQVVNHGGDNHLGGKLIDWKIVEQLLAPVVEKEYALPDFRRGNPEWIQAFAQLKHQAEKAKIRLSRDPVAEIIIEELCQDEHGVWIRFEYELHRSDVEPLVEPFVQKSVNICKRVLKEKRLSTDNIEKVILVGGPTFAPIFREIISDKLGIPLEFHKDPLTVVARGAAVFSGTQRIPEDVGGRPLAPGQYRLELEYDPIGSEPEPSIGGRVTTSKCELLTGFTIEFVESKSQWRSGRIRIGDNGEFITTIRAEKGRANEFLIELRDGSGNIHEVVPNHFTYTIGTAISKQILTHSVGVALANNEMQVLVEKGTPLPLRHRSSRPNHTTVALKKGESGTFLKIPIVEGENIRHADRNPLIGSLEVSGEKIPHNLPVGSEVEITVEIDESRLVQVKAYVPILDEEYLAEANLGITRVDPKQQAAQLEHEKTRLEELRARAEKTGSKTAKEALNHIHTELMIHEIEASLDAAQTDADATYKCHQDILSLQNAIDKIEEELEWPARLSETEESIKGARQILDEHGEAGDKRKFDSLESEIRESISNHDADLLSQKISALDRLVMPILTQQPSYWVMWFNYLEEKKPHMKNLTLAEQLITQGRRAIDTQDLVGLQAVVRQLISLLPPDEQQEARGYGSTII